MRKLEITLSVLLAGSAPALAQKRFTVPAKGVHDKLGIGLGYIVPPHRQLPTRMQCLYSTKDLPAPAIQIREIAFQPNVIGPSDGLDPAVVTLTLDMSIGPRSPRKWSNFFVKNLGKTVTRVFSGKIQLPKVTQYTTKNWHFRIPLKKPFLAIQKLGASLVLDFSTTSVAWKMTGRQWQMVYARQDTGEGWFQGIGYNCHFQKINILWQTTPGGMYVGSKWGWTAGPLLANQPGFLIFGDAGWGSKWAGMTLPIDLKRFGAPGCTWGVRPLLLLPFVVNNQGLASLSGLVIPGNPQLANTIFYIQGAYAYPKANALGLQFLPSLKYRVGSFEDHNGAALGQVRNSPPGKWGGGLQGDPVPWCRITY